jgi:Leucine-rich repeat (LRR) protein
MNFTEQGSKTISNVSNDQTQKVQALTIKNKELTFIPHGCGVLFESLLILVFSTNKLRTVEEAEMDSMVNLEVLNLSLNQIEYIEGDVFKNNRNLQLILLGSNKIKFLSEATFRGLKNLQEVSLFKNYCISMNLKDLAEVDWTRTLENCSYARQINQPLMNIIESLKDDIKNLKNQHENLKNQLENSTTPIESHDDVKAQIIQQVHDASSSPPVILYVINILLFGVFLYIGWKVYQKEIFVVKNCYKIDGKYGGDCENATTPSRSICFFGSGDFER